jgi:hypothetical protein
MGYKMLGYVVWRGARWYIRRRVAGGAKRKLALAGVAALAIGGAVAAGRAAGGDNLAR